MIYAKRLMKSKNEISLRNIVRTTVCCVYKRWMSQSGMVGNVRLVTNILNIVNIGSLRKGLKSQSNAAIADMKIE